MIGINGLGRIGRLAARQLAREGLLAGLNDPAELGTLVHLLRRDSIHHHAPLEAEGQAAEEREELLLEGRRIPLFHAADPGRIPWDSAGVRLVVESSGRFTRRADAARHLRGGVTHAVISAPSPDPDFTVMLPFNGDRLDLGDSPLLLFAGGLIETLESKKILFQQAIPRQTAQELVDLAREKGWQMQTYIDDVLRTAKDDKWIRGYEEITHSKACICGDEFYRVQGDCNKLLSRGEHDDLVARKALIEERFPGQFNILFSMPTFLEIMPSGVDKGKGIRRLGELYGITADEIMALGDSQNDLDMLKAAGFPVAMANAADEVKAVASYVTASNNDDGVAAAVEKFVL